jgi:hypothetical protein
LKLRDISVAALAISASVPIVLPTARAASAQLRDAADNWEFSLQQLDTDSPDSWRYQPHVSSTLTDSLPAFFASLLPADRRIERVYWIQDRLLFNVWTVIDQPDDEIETSIYDAQVRFIQMFPELECDFTVLYRFGRPEQEIRPAEALSVSPRA